MEGLSVVTFKLCSVGAILLISLVGSFLPLKLRNFPEEKRNMVTELSRFFTAGVFLGVGLIHMLPEAADNLRKSGVCRVGGKDFPLAYLICALGVVIIWFLEQHTFRDRSRMMAVAANASKLGGASICFVRVEPVSTYGALLTPSDESQSPVVRIRPSPAKYTPPLPQNETRALLLQAPGGRGNDGGGITPGLGAPPEDVALLIPLEDGEQTQNGGDVVVPVQDLEQLSKGERWGGNRWGNTTRGEREERGRLSSEGDTHPSSLHRTSLSSDEGGSLIRHASSGQRKGGKKLPRSESGGLWSPPLVNCSTEPHEDRFTHPKHHHHSHSDLGGLDDHSHESPSVNAGLEGPNNQLHQHSHTVEHHHVMLGGGSGMAYILASLFSLHSFVVGAAFGIGREIDQGAISLLIAVLAHKGTEAFSVGVQFAAEGVPLARVVTIMLLYCAMTPLGVFVGMAELLVRGNTGRLVANMTQAFGAGTVLYIVMMQLTDQDGMGSRPNRWIQALLILLGLGIMSSVALVA